MPIEPTMTIGGKPATSDDGIDVRNPADLKTIVGRYPNGSAAHAANAVAAAYDAFPAWRTMGPLNNERQFKKVTELLAATKEAGLDVVELGTYADGTDPAGGYFMLPHLVLNPPDDATIAACEQMGPILPIMKFTDVEEAVRRANDTPYGLASSVWSRDLDKAFAIGARLEAGATWVNSHNLGSMDVDGPFAGSKESGVGQELGGEVGLAAYTQYKTINDNCLGI